MSKFHIREGKSIIVFRVHDSLLSMDGNDAIRFYEKYGFRINAQILRMNV